MPRRKTNPWTREEPATEAARTRGRKAKRKGSRWEAQLNAMAKHYRAQGTANIRQVGAPFRPTRSPTKTRHGFEHHGVFEDVGPCDFIGHVGRIPFEADAKSSDVKTRWEFKALEKHQAESLDMVHAVDGYAGILARIGGRGFWLPWSAVRDRWWSWYAVTSTGGRAKHGTASLSLAECERVGVEFRGGDFLPAVMESHNG